jgi:hypothetical protein
MSQAPAPNSSGSEPLPAGMWESTQSDGITVGMMLSVVPARIPGAVYPEGTPIPKGSRLEVGVFQRKHKQITFGDVNYFKTASVSEDGTAVYGNRKLELQYRDPRSGSEIQVELQLDPNKDEWTGRFHRGGFDRQVTLVRVPERPEIAAPKLLLTSTNTPALFRVEMENPGVQDLVFNLGMVLSNGRAQYMTALTYTLTAPDGRVHHLNSPGPGIVSGAIDPLIVPLPSGGRYSVLLDLEECYVHEEHTYRLHLVPGRYTLQAEYTGRDLLQTNPHNAGLTSLRPWTGSVTSPPIEFNVQWDKGTTSGN